MPFVYILMADTREDHEPIVSVRANIQDSYADAKEYILKHNKDFFDGDKYQPDRYPEKVEEKKLPAKEFYLHYLSAWLDSPTIIKKKVK